MDIQQFIHGTALSQLCFLCCRRGRLDQRMDCTSSFTDIVLLSSLTRQSFPSFVILVSVLRVGMVGSSERHSTCLTIVFVCMCGAGNGTHVWVTCWITTEPLSHFHSSCQYIKLLPVKIYWVNYWALALILILSDHWKQRHWVPYLGVFLKWQYKKRWDNSTVDWKGRSRRNSPDEPFPSVTKPEPSLPFSSGLVCILKP